MIDAAVERSCAFTFLKLQFGVVSCDMVNTKLVDVIPVTAILHIVHQTHLSCAVHAI